MQAQAALAKQADLVNAVQTLRWGGSCSPARQHTFRFKPSIVDLWNLGRMLQDLDSEKNAPFFGVGQ
eukprot:4531588-Amphidinium_carterae.1